MEDKREAVGVIVALDGCDAAGKSTHAKFLAEYIKATLFRFPNRETPVGKIIDGYLKGKWSVPEHGPMVHQALQFANRLEMAVPIFKLHSAGKFVVVDRYIASGVVYGRLDGIDPNYLIESQKWLPQPTLSLLLDAPIEVLMSRLRARSSNEEIYENEEKIAKAQTYYREYWGTEPRWGYETVDVSGSVEATQKIIVRILNRYISGS